MQIANCTKTARVFGLALHLSWASWATLLGGQASAKERYLGCRFGNSVEGSEAGLSIRVQTEGPGPVEAVVDCSLSGPARVQLLARQAGNYSLTLLSDAQDALGQGPIQVSAVCDSADAI